MRTVARAQHQKWGVILAIVGTLCIAVATLTPGPPLPPNARGAVCRGWCDDELLADFARNVVLFLPMALGLRLSGVSSRRVIVVGSCFSAAIELLQLGIIVGREASLLDWISNTLGTILGTVVVSRHRLLLKPPPALARMLSSFAFLGWLLIVALGVWGIQGAPTHYPYWGQRSPRLRNAPPFLGELISARVNGSEIPSAVLTNDEIVRAPLGTGHLRIDGVARPGPPTPQNAVAPIVRIVDASQREIVLLGRSGDRMVFKYRLRATALRLQTPAFVLEQAFTAESAANTSEAEPAESLSAALEGSRVTLVARGNGRSARQSVVPLSAGYAWSFFVPWTYALAPYSLALAAVWLGVLLFPTAYWAAWASSPHPKRWFLCALLLAVSIVLLIPRLFDMPSAPAWEIGGSIAGALLGWVVGSLATPERPAHSSMPQLQ